MISINVIIDREDNTTKAELNTQATPIRKHCSTIPGWNEKKSLMIFDSDSGGVLFNKANRWYEKVWSGE